MNWTWTWFSSSGLNERFLFQIKRMIRNECWIIDMQKTSMWNRIMFFIPGRWIADKIRASWWIKYASYNYLNCANEVSKEIKPNLHLSYQVFRSVPNLIVTQIRTLHTVCEHIDIDVVIFCQNRFIEILEVHGVSHNLSHTDRTRTSLILLNSSVNSSVKSFNLNESKLTWTNKSFPNFLPDGWSVSHFCSIAAGLFSIRQRFRQQTVGLKIEVGFHFNLLKYQPSNKIS